MYLAERTRSIIFVAVGLTTVAEVFYFFVWGIILFPTGSIIGKLVWTATCGTAMGSVVAVLTILFVENRLKGRNAIIAAAMLLALVGSFCAILCSNIDAKLGYFGGAENQGLFIWSGVIPSLLGGPIYGWIIYHRLQNDYD